MIFVYKQPVGFLLGFYYVLLHTKQNNEYDLDGMTTTSKLLRFL